MGIFTEHGTKIYGGLTSFFGALQLLISTGKFEGLLSKAAIGWVDIFTALAIATIGGMTVARGFNNTTAQRVASAMETAIKSQPAKEGGFVKALMLAFMLAICVPIVTTISACTNTRAALSNADTPSDYALVFLEGYDSALKTANQLKASGALAGDNLARVQAAEKKAWPLVQKIDPLRRAYEQTKSAQDAATLQLAIDNAIREAAEFIRLVRELRD